MRRWQHAAAEEGAMRTVSRPLRVCIAASVVSVLACGAASAQTPSAGAVVTPQIEVPEGQTGSGAQARSGNASPARTAYVIGPEDQIVIRVAENPDLSDKPQRVDQNGEIRLPMIGRVQAAGLTPQQLEASLTEKFKVFIVEPDVMVAVLETRSQPVSVIGAVMQPGVRQLEGKKTLLQVLLLAGGASADAGPTLTVTRRKTNGALPLPTAVDDATGQFSIADVELHALLEGRAPGSDIELMANDVINVSKAEMVFVIGEVGKAGPIPLVRGTSVSVLQAVSSSGGLNRTAAASNARILRSVPGTDERKEVRVDLKKILAGKSGDVALIAGDILVVPDSTSKRATTRALEAAIQMGLMVGSYGLIH
ncbi:MAG: polysaccharide biosynthesis/export family protein [Vicinamibacterales bacterium]